MPKFSVAIKFSRALLLIPAIALVVAGCGGSSSGTGTSGKTYRIALSMSYTNNEWETEQRNGFLAEALTPPYNTRVKTDVFVAGADPQTQISQIQQMIAQGYNAILTFPSDPNALTGVIRQACAAKVVIIAYSSDLPLVCPYAYSINTDETSYGAAMAEWLAKAINYQGDIVMSTGIAGTTAGTLRSQGAKAVFAKYPNIHIVGQFAGNWDNAVTQQGMAQQLAAHPNIAGVYTEAGPGVVNALIAAHHKLIPVTGEAQNGLRQQLTDSSLTGQGLTGMTTGNPPFIAAYAMKLAVAILDGQKFSQKNVVPLPVSDYTQMKACPTFDPSTPQPGGCNVFPSSMVDAEFFSDFYDAKLVPELCVAAVQKGTPCTGQTAKPPLSQAEYDAAFPAGSTSAA
jgi:ribose transport system substrate-binding protein